MDIKKTNWIFFNLCNMAEMASNSPDSSDYEIYKEMGNEHYAAGIHVFDDSNSENPPKFILVKPFLKKEDIPEESKRLEREETLYLSQPLSDREVIIIERSFPIMKALYEEKDELSVYARSFCAAFSLRLPLLTENEENDIFHKFDEEEPITLEDGDLVRVKFKNGETGYALFSGVQTDRKKVRFTVIWTEKFEVYANRQRIQYKIGERASIPPDALEKVKLHE